MPDPTPTPTPEATSPVNSDGSFTENWSEKYGEDNKATLSRFNNFDDFVTSHVSLRNKLGKNPDSLVEIPSETSSDEVREAWAKAHNVPDAYEYALSDEMAVKLGPLNDDKMEALREFGKSKNWSQADFKDVLDFYHNSIASDIDANEASFNEQQTAAAVAGKAELRKIPGWQSESEYESKVQTAQAVMEKYELTDFIAENNLQSDPKLLVGLNKIAESMSEDTLKGLKGSTNLSADNINTQIADLRSQQDAIRKENTVNFKSDPKFKDIEGRLKVLYQQRPA